MTSDELAVAYLAAFDTGDPDRVAELVADGFVNEQVAALGVGCTGRDEYRRRLGAFLEQMPGLSYRVERILSGDGDGDVVAIAYRMTASPPQGSVDVRGVMVLETAGGLITRRTDYWDSLTYLRQTGQTHLA